MPRPSARIETGSRTSDHIELTTADLRLVVAPALGGRIVSLEDRRTGHDWLVSDPSRAADADMAGWGDEDAVFTGERAFGWDECLPTVASCADPLDPGGPSLRDHGDGWGRSSEVSRLAATAAVEAGVRLAWEVPARYRFERTIRLDGPTVRTDYRMTSLGPDMPFLWSMHPLLALEPGARLVLGGVHRVAITNATGFDLGSVDGTVDWPLARLRDGRTTDLSRIAGVEAGTALKAYARAASLDGPAIAIQPDGAGLAIEWDRQAAPFLGVWIDAGGWPAGTGRHQVALEPTTAPHDDLASAVAAGSAAWARVDHDVTWWTTLRLVGANAGPIRP